MKNWKRIVAMCIGGILSALLFSGCGKNADGGTPAATKVPEHTIEPIVDVMVGPTLDAEYAADFSVSNVFGKNMVVQRGEYLRIWGTAPESENGKKISGQFKGMFAETLVENGEWVLTFGARLEASCELNHSMRLYTDSKEVIFEDILVGDVYMVIGQSNVAYSMQNHWQYVSDSDKGGSKGIDKTAPIRIHYNSLTQTAGYPKRGTQEVCPELLNKSKWKVATSGAISNFSAIGYLFAQNMVKITEGKVPLGIIEIDGNGQPLGAFMPNEVAQKCGSDTYNSKLGYYQTTGVNADAGRYMYNHYMYPFEKLAIAGIIWYQGESDFQVANARVFAENFSELMTYMRSTHNLVNKDFPVYVIEFPPNYTQPADFKPTASSPMWAAMDVGLIRAVVGSIPQYLDNCYLSVSSDLWLDRKFWNTLHPNCKFEQGQRTATLAAGVMGLIPMEEACGPVLKSVRLSDNGKKAILTYDNVGRGLKTSDGGDTVKGFAILQDDFRIVQPNSSRKLKAKITGSNEITITCSEEMKGVVYNCIMDNVYGEDVNLCGSSGMPAGAVLMYAQEKS